MGAHPLIGLCVGNPGGAFENSPVIHGRVVACGRAAVDASREGTPPGGAELGVESSLPGTAGNGWNTPATVGRPEGVGRVVGVQVGVAGPGSTGHMPTAGFIAFAANSTNCARLYGLT